MIEQALNPLAANLAVRTVGEDRGVLERDVDLIVEAVGNPALDLFAGDSALASLMSAPARE
jgi:hypothetical protein